MLCIQLKWVQHLNTRPEITKAEVSDVYHWIKKKNAQQKPVDVEAPSYC